jgi:hypothetical protein
MQRYQSARRRVFDTWEGRSKREAYSGSKKVMLADRTCAGRSTAIGRII